MNIAPIPRPALRYYGGKFRLAPWIIAQFPPHTTYVEPFGGAGGVLLRKPPSYNEIYNDVDGEVVNFFRMLRERPDELIRAIDLTPYARSEQLLAFEPTEGLDDLERAAGFTFVAGRATEVEGPNGGQAGVMKSVTYGKSRSLRTGMRLPISTRLRIG